MAVELNNGYKIEALLPEMVFHHWQIVEPFIKQFLDKSEGESSVESIKQNVVAGNFHCFVISNKDEVIGVCIFKVDHFVGYSALHIIGLGGKKGFWKNFKEAHAWLERLAKEWNCDRISFWSSRGWSRLFGKFKFSGTNGENYEEVYKVMHMKLNK